ncbi:hypothetical protein CDD80_2585 [Ophiocordyceps camponoti-rufipedis]|uniref:Uncharacterized protein n=1 Tax=Ophiocordyceps camponoti-rufipedis TaxID=2004952 RepID=A0A2C5Z5P7_9HYPO|nr:hypothetical protein CDD80_2585 [Ophiocordyceps camponoti-rufipedis]
MKALAAIVTILRVASARPIEDQPIPDTHYGNNYTADDALVNKSSARDVVLESVIQQQSPHAVGDGSASGLELTGVAGEARAVRSAENTRLGSPLVTPEDTLSAILNGLHKSGLVEKPQVIGAALGAAIDPAVLTQELLTTYTTRATTYSAHVTKSTALLTTSTMPVVTLTALFTAHRKKPSTTPAPTPTGPATTPASQASKPEATAKPRPEQANATEESALTELKELYVKIGFHRDTHPCDDKLRCLFGKAPSYWVREVKACVAKPGFYWAGPECLLIVPRR